MILTLSTSVEHSNRGRQSRQLRVYQIEHWEALACQTGFSCAALARECGISLRHLQRYFQAVCGFPLQKWLNSLRMGMAFDLLLKSESVKFVAYHLGFKQPSHFSREFKRFYGLSPREVTKHYAYTRSLLIQGSHDWARDSCFGERQKVPHASSRFLPP